ncbi:hypothetical protein VHUM_01093 [Vanrija humicola]|uniref:Succinate dehydrogenase [ubiquinone] cytochrome b small subunit n=1 Tax=Vanrija humicola TaxID=5417 RepID=A0A7D8V4X7_VANHU|nr:hypothetical protein VHUM_01093 [Vanrija humicola]
MSFVRPVSALRTGLALGVRPLHTSRIVAVQASKRRQAISPDETAGFKYTPDNAIFKGTVNDPTSFPPPNRAHGSYHWAFERLLSAGLIPLTAAAVVASPTAYPLVDGALGVAIIVHTHIGFTACIDDYVHERKFGKLGTAARWALNLGTLSALVGLYEFNTNDIGITELAIKLFSA